MLQGIGLGAQGMELKETVATPETNNKAQETTDKALLGGAIEAKEGVEPPKKEEPLSSRFAALARKEKAALKRSQETKQREAEISAREAKLKELEDSYTLGKQNPIEALKRLGWSYEDITNHILNDQKPTPEREIKSVRDEMAQWRKEQAEKEEKAKLDQEDRQKSQYKQAIEDFKVEMNDFIETNSEAYELINLHEQQELVYATIEEHYSESMKSGKPKILSNKEACDLVEKYLEEQLDKLAQTKKFKSKFQQAQEPQATKDDSKGTQAMTKTLSNTMVSSSSPSLLPAKTEQERLQRALAALTK